MRRSKIATGSDSDPVKPHTVRFPDSIWESLTVEAQKRRVTVSDILVEAMSNRIISVSEGVTWPTQVMAELDKREHAREEKKQKRKAKAAPKRTAS